MKIKATFALPLQISEGWGVTADESKVNQNGFYQLYISDGTSTIYVVDGETLTVQSSITVHSGLTPYSNLNELEFANGHIYASVWMQDILLKIDPQTGKVVKTYDISTLENAERAFQTQTKGFSNQDVLNGIAFDPKT